MSMSVIESNFSERETICYVKYWPKFNFTTQFLIGRDRQMFTQGWEFAHLIYEQIARFLSKKLVNVRFTQKKSDSRIRSFLVS